MDSPVAAFRPPREPDSRAQPSLTSPVAPVFRTSNLRYSSGNGSRGATIKLALVVFALAAGAGAAPAYRQLSNPSPPPSVQPSPQPPSPSPPPPASSPPAISTINQIISPGPAAPSAIPPLEASTTTATTSTSALSQVTSTPAIKNMHGSLLGESSWRKRVIVALHCELPGNVGDFDHINRTERRWDSGRAYSRDDTDLLTDVLPASQTTSSKPTATSSAGSLPSDNGGAGLSIPALIGIIAGAVLFVVLVTCFFACTSSRKSDVDAFERPARSRPWPQFVRDNTSSIRFGSRKGSQEEGIIVAAAAAENDVSAPLEPDSMSLSPPVPKRKSSKITGRRPFWSNGTSQGTEMSNATAQTSTVTLTPSAPITATEDHLMHATTSTPERSSLLQEEEEPGRPETPPLVRPSSRHHLQDPRRDSLTLDQILAARPPDQSARLWAQVAAQSYAIPMPHLPSPYWNAYAITHTDISTTDAFSGTNPGGKASHRINGLEVLSVRL
ncbi:hypothetical protein M427DRAFT_37370 [Gonapodya prolifera JEL478]|uniref:Mid2 domain-containing protein n=1 Tax=Gonapodya prolifera (strain JEL478) TaxID=1344416 RepID=A0A139A0X5_GONPJ|nr:hypothetical protein M427DRAFT_37370 [Gonapodya prolifera JEL478]|eukprot:KXS10430.1 hypothetical protein M427DRAFT_37370 [Gonapodya prolifera JEL478]